MQRKHSILLWAVTLPAPVSVTEICYLHVCVDPVGGERYGEPLKLIIPHVQVSSNCCDYNFFLKAINSTGSWTVWGPEKRSGKYNMSLSGHNWHREEESYSHDNSLFVLIFLNTVSCKWWKCPQMRIQTFKEGNNTPRFTKWDKGLGTIWLYLLLKMVKKGKTRKRDQGKRHSIRD
jgi:hypothetical protein